MTLQELVAYFRAQVADEDQPYLWSDEEVLLYAIDAQDMLVEATGGIADTTVAAADVGSPATRLPDLALTADTPFTAHSSLILRIRSGRLLTAARDIEFISESGMDKTVMLDYGFSQSQSFDDEDTGDVKFAVLGVRDNQVRWVRVPSEADTCRLHFYRLPYPRIADLDDTLEVDSRHHIHLVHWMKYLAYSKQDAETRDDKQAANARAAAEHYADQARRRLERQRYKPRVVSYGGL
jgi:hypothetical protein